MRKSALDIIWPESHFTIMDIQNEHPTSKNITIRFRINKAIEENILAYIGKNPTSVGRPTIVFTKVPVQDSVLQQAAESGVILDEAFADKLVKIVKVNLSSQPVVVEKSAVVDQKQTVNA